MNYFFDSQKVDFFLFYKFATFKIKVSVQVGT